MLNSKKLIQLVFICLLPLSVVAQNSWWNDAVFYEVFVRSFKDSDGDGKGDLQGLIDKLDYLNDGNPNTTADLGITAIWLMPIQESPSYHGYDVTDYRTIESDYGTNQLFKTFMTEAHNRGIKVIVDLVMNHTSSQHPWFTSSSDPMSPKRNWYTYQTTNPGNLGPWGQTVWYNRDGYYNYAIFWSEMPDLNYNTPEVKTEMFDVARFWLEDMEVDGFRLDAVKYIFESGSALEDTPETISFWQDFRTHYKSVNPEALAVGEAWTTTDKIKPYVVNNGTDGLDFCFEFDLATAILNAANTGTVSALQAQIDEVIESYPSLQYGTFLTNHDINRAYTQLGNSASRSKVAADLLLTLPGVPYIYYGEEIGMTGSGADENKRTPLHWDNTAQGGFTSGIPWKALNADYSTKNIAVQQVDPASLWTRYRKLISIRTSEAALRKGTYKSVTASAASVISFVRQYNDENVLVITNTASSATSNVQLSLTDGIVPGNYTLLELMGGASSSLTIDASGGFSNFTVNIPARSSLIYKLEDVNALEDPFLSTSIAVYPVPASKEVFVELSKNYSGDISYTITDLLGIEKVSSSFNASSGQHRLSGENLSTGVYKLKLEYNGKSEFFKIEIQK